MYAVVGCSACHAIWILSDAGATAQCPRCRRTHDRDRLRTFAETESAEAARDARSRVLAERSDHGDDAAGFSSLVDAADAAGVDDDAYLTAHDIDVSELDREESGTRRSLPDAVRDVVDAMDTATHDRVLDRLDAEGRDRERVATALDRLVEEGELLHVDDVYRRL